MAAESLAVVLADPAGLRLPDIGKAISEFRGIPLQDAAHQAKNCWGIVADSLSAEEAQKLGRALEKAGLKSCTVPSASLIKVPDPRIPSAILLMTEGLHLDFKSGAAGILPWGLIFLVSAASFKETSFKTEKIETGEGTGGKAFRMGILLATGIPLPGKKKEIKEVKKEVSDIIYMVDIFTVKPLGRIRLDPRRINFSFLKGRMQMNLLGNFKTLMEDILNKAPQATLSHGSRVMREGRPLSQMLYDSPLDFENECRWLLTLLSI